MSWNDDHGTTALTPSSTRSFGLQAEENSVSISSNSRTRFSLCPGDQLTHETTPSTAGRSIRPAGSSLEKTTPSTSPPAKRQTVSIGGRHHPVLIGSNAAPTESPSLFRKRSRSPAINQQVGNTYLCSQMYQSLHLKEEKKTNVYCRAPQEAKMSKLQSPQGRINDKSDEKPLLSQISTRSARTGMKKKTQSPKKGDNRSAPICIQDDSDDEVDGDLSEEELIQQTGDLPSKAIGEVSYNSTLLETWSKLALLQEHSFGSAGTDIRFFEMYDAKEVSSAEPAYRSYLTKFNLRDKCSLFTIQVPTATLKIKAYNFDPYNLDMPWREFTKATEIALKFSDIDAIRCSIFGRLASCRDDSAKLMMLRIEISLLTRIIYIIMDEESCLTFQYIVGTISELKGKVREMNSTGYAEELRKLRHFSEADKLNPCAPPTDASSLLARVATRSAITKMPKFKQDLTEVDKHENDTTVLFVFPIDKKSVDPITITVGDQRRLNCGEWLNDNLIDLRIKFLLHDVNVKEYAAYYKNRANLTVRHPVFIDNRTMYAFSCHFFTALVDKSISRDRVKAMTKHVNIFEKDYIFIPVNKTGHWSLICMVRPGCIVAQRQRKFIGDSDENSGYGNNRSCIIHLDSLNLHKRSTFNQLYTFLNEEYCSCFPEDNIKPDCQIFNAKSCPLFQPKEAWQQENGVDCGVYVIEFVKHVMRGDFYSSRYGLEKSISAFFSEFKFSESDADSARSDFLIELLELSMAYEAEKKREIERRNVRRERKLAANDGDNCDDADIVVESVCSDVTDNSAESMSIVEPVAPDCISDNVNSTAGKSDLPSSHKNDDAEAMDNTSRQFDNISGSRHNNIAAMSDSKSSGDTIDSRNMRIGIKEKGLCTQEW